MGDPEQSEQSGGDKTTSAPRERNLVRRILLVLIVIALLVTGFFIGAAVFPRWWAQRIGDVVDGRLIFGNFLGFIVGAIFTFLPLFVLYLAFRFRGGWKRLAAFVVFALLLLSPNLATLGIVMGSGNAAHAGERILDVEGPGFRGASLVGGIVGALIAFGFIALLTSRRRNKRKAAELKAELKSRE